MQPCRKAEYDNQIERMGDMEDITYVVITKEEYRELIEGKVKAECEVEHIRSKLWDAQKIIRLYEDKRENGNDELGTV